MGPRDKRVAFWLPRVSPALIRRAPATSNLLPDDYRCSRHETAISRPTPRDPVRRVALHVGRADVRPSTAQGVGSLVEGRSYLQLLRRHWVRECPCRQGGKPVWSCVPELCTG